MTSPSDSGEWTALIPVTVTIFVPVPMPSSVPQPGGASSDIIDDAIEATVDADEETATIAMQAVMDCPEVTAAYERLHAAVASHRFEYPATRAHGTLWLGSVPSVELD